MKRRTQRGLATWLADSDTPVFLVDARRKVLFFNHGCERLTGWEAADVVGQVCDYVTEPDPTQVEAVTGLLCPPPELAAGETAVVPAFVINRDGERMARQILFLPLRDDAGGAERVLGVVLPLPAAHPAGPPSPAHKLHAELAALRGVLRERYDVATLVGDTPVFHRLLAQCRLARGSLVNVHLCGEAGTGKEHLARLIHYDSALRLRALVPLDCRRLPARELKNTLARLIREAGEDDPPRLQPGSVYLKDVDDLPADVQELLVEELAAGGPSEGAVRILSASTRPLERAVSEDRLREECYCLLTELTIAVPPLRERKEDLPLLATHLLESLNRDQESQVGGFAPDVWDEFRRYEWPGNQDELQAVIREARERCRGKLIAAADLPFRFRAGREAQAVGPAATTEIAPLSEVLARAEKEQIERALQQARQNKSRAAEWLGITRARLYRRMQHLGIEDAAGTDAPQSPEGDPP